jgi:hypothetical protein
MKTAEYGKHSINYPSTWEELSPKQLIKCLNILDSNPLFVAQVKILYLLSNFRFKTILVKLRRKSKTDHLAAVELSALRQIFDFVKTPPSFQVWKFPFIKVNGIKWIGPADAFNNLTIGEFGRAEDFYKHLQKEPNNTIYLNRFLACLYRPKKYIWFGKRKPFTEDCIMDNYQKFNNIPLGTKKAILLNFSATRENLFGRFKNAFSKSADVSEMQKYGWTGTINVFCTHHNIVPKEFRERNIIDVLVLLDSLAIEAKERKKKDDN